MAARTFQDSREAMSYLKAMFDDAKAQRCRRKFVEDCQRIHHRRKYEPCILILPGHDQEVWFAKLEANGIWEMVFQYLTNPSDVESAYHACGLFREHLEEKRKIMMLPKVFNVLWRKRHLEFKGFQRASDERNALSRDVLNQRLVSKAWKKSFEEEFLIPLDFSRPIWNPLSWHWNWSDRIVCQFTRTWDIDIATERLRNPSTCASLLRLVDVNDDEVRGGGTDNTFYKKLENFLDIHGQSVWGFRFSQTRKEKDFCYEGLCNMVSRMPNLKALWLCDSCRWAYFPNDETSRARLQQDSARLRAMIAQRPFPTIRTLELCSLKFCTAHDESLVVEILSRNLHIRAVHYPSWSFDRDAVISGFVWDALQNVRLEYFHLGYEGRNRLYVDHLLRLGQLEWPLKELVLTHSSVDHEVDVSASTILRILSRFKESLEVVYMIVDGLRFRNDPGKIVVDFPKLLFISFPSEIED